MSFEPLAISSELQAPSSKLKASISSELVLAGSRPDDVVAFERLVVDFFVSAADLLGVPKSVAAIYGIIFASPQPLSFAEIGERLDISKGSVSQGLRVLRDVGAVREAQHSSELLAMSHEPDAESPESLAMSPESDSKLKAPISELLPSSKLKAPSLPLTSRSARYEPDLELRKLVARFIESRLERQLRAGESRLTALRQAVPQDDPTGAAELGRRLKSLSDWHNKASALLPLARTFLKLGA